MYIYIYGKYPDKRLKKSPSSERELIFFLLFICARKYVNGDVVVFGSDVSANVLRETRLCIKIYTCVTS